MLPQGQCKPNAMKLASIAEVQPELANSICKGTTFFAIEGIIYAF